MQSQRLRGNKLITDFSIQIPKEGYSPSRQKANDGLKYICSLIIRRDSQTDNSATRSKVKSNMKFSNTLALYKELHEKSIKRQEMLSKGVLGKGNFYESKVTTGNFPYPQKTKEID